MTYFSIIPVAWFAQVSLERPIADNGVHALIGSRLRQNPRSATRGLGKTFSKPFIIAISPRKSGDHAKIGVLRLVIWEKHLGNRLLWRFSPKKAALTPKPATALGKFDWETVYHGDFSKKSGDPAKPGDQLGEIRSEKCL